MKLNQCIQTVLVFWKNGSCHGFSFFSRVELIWKNGQNIAFFGESISYIYELFICITKYASSEDISVHWIIILFTWIPIYKGVSTTDVSYQITVILSLVRMMFEK